MRLNMNINESEAKQSDVFLEGEGDRWFERNKAALGDNTNFYDTETIKRVLQHFIGSINSICEIGSGNGAKLNDLCNFFDSFGFGIDPSLMAVNDGNKTYKNINLKVSTADNLPFTSSQFDLVYFGFCLYLVDRSDIFRVVAEADRVLRSGGFLAILDFDPTMRHQKSYHHKLGIASYKTDYATFFTDSGHYYLVAKESFSHGANHFSEDSGERISITILYKEPKPYLLPNIFLL